MTYIKIMAHYKYICIKLLLLCSTVTLFIFVGLIYCQGKIYIHQKVISNQKPPHGPEYSLTLYMLEGVDIKSFEFAYIQPNRDEYQDYKINTKISVQVFENVNNQSKIFALIGDSNTSNQTLTLIGYRNNHFTIIPHIGSAGIREFVFYSTYISIGNFDDDPDLEVIESRKQGHPSGIRSIEMDVYEYHSYNEEYFLSCRFYTNPSDILGPLTLDLINKTPHLQDKPPHCSDQMRKRGF